MEKMTLVFTSFRDSMNLDGLKVSIERRPPRLCSYPVLPFMEIPKSDNLDKDGLERVVRSVMDNKINLIMDFIINTYELGIYKIVFCDWKTKEQIAQGDFCPSRVIKDYLEKNSPFGNDAEFPFPVEFEMRDGREVL